jgi:glycosyltransferase involved in cell wall biosynthesis
VTARYTSVVYVLLGDRRIRAAKQHTADLAAAGAQVLLVVAENREWANAELTPGVTLHRLVGKGQRQTIRAARRFLFGADGPLAAADLLVPGDPAAMPIAEDAHRRFPKLTILTEPSPDPARRTAEADLAVITPWYPSPDDPFAGAFVKATTGTIVDDFDRIATLHTENWVYSDKGLTGKVIDVSLNRQLDRTGGVVVLDTAEGELTRVASPLVTTGNYAIWARAQIARLAATLPTGRIEAPLIHAHTGHYAGAVATALARDDARIVVTEHATFLPKVFKQPGSRIMYGEMLNRVDRLLCVGQYLYDLVAKQFPQHVGKLRIVPNPIDFDQFVVRPEPPREPLRWLYIGRMLAHKGVITLVRAFAQIAAEEPRATLTLVGAGVLEKPLRELIAELGLTGRVTQRPAVPPEDVAGLIHDHDLLVHASHLETFGMTIVEAVATETPVLVARSQGPAETLHGLDGVAGALFEVTEDPAVIADAYRRLRTGWASLDLATARRELRSRYGREAVGAQLREVFREVMAEKPVAERLAGQRLAVPLPAPGADRITVVSISPPVGVRTRRYVESVRARGYGVDLIVADPATWSKPAFDDGVRLHGIGPTEDRKLIRRAERGIVTVFPRWVLGFARARAAELPFPLPEALVITGQRVHRRVADRINRRIYNPAYAFVRPRVLWRITRREVLPTLDGARTRRVVVYGVPGITIGARLAKQWPDVPVSTTLAVPTEDAKADA